MRDLSSQGQRRFWNQAAFTLLEVMIAITVFGVVMAAIYSSWSAILRGSKVSLDAAAEAQRARVALRCLEESFSSIRFFSMNQAYYSFLVDTSGEFASVSFVASLSSAFPGSGLFVGQPVRRVTFSVEPGTNTPAQLVVHQTPLLEPPQPELEPYKIVLARDVNLFELEFWDPRNGEWMTEWIYTNQIPMMVKISLGFGELKYSSPRREQVRSSIVAPASMPVPAAFHAPAIGNARGLGTGDDSQPGNQQQR